MTKITKFICFSFALILLFSGCFKKHTDDDLAIKSRNLKLTKLNFYFRSSPKGDPYTDEVVDEIEKRSLNKLNIKLNINWIAFDEFFSTVKSLIKSGNEIDAYISPLSILQTIVQQDELASYMDITHLFPDNAPDIYRRYTRSELAEASYEGKVYAIPGKNYASKRLYVLVRDDLMKKYELNDIKTFEDYEAYLRKVTLNSKGLKKADIATKYIIDTYLESKGYIEYNSLGLYYNRNNSRIKLVSMENLPEYREAEQLIRRWAEKGYIEPIFSSSSRVQNDMSFNSTVGTYDNVNTLMGYMSVPVRAYSSYSNTVFSKVENSMMSSMYFSSNSKNIPRALQLLNWLSSNQENYDLIMYGIKEKDYKLNDGRIKLLENNSQVYHKNFYTNGGSFFENIDYNRPLENQSIDYWKKYKKDFERLTELPILTGFSYPYSKMQWAKELSQNRYNELRNLENSIFEEDYDLKLSEFKKQQKQIGINEFIKSLEEHIIEWKKDN